jgi:hypothetical protein
MGTRKKKRPEWELPVIFTTAVQEYLGPTTVNVLTAEQSRDIMETCVNAASEIGKILEGAKKL